MRIVLLFIALLMIPCTLWSAGFSAQVTAVVDGDTIDVRHSERLERIELYGIDCPEKGQAFGKRAKQATSDLVIGKQVHIAKRGMDREKHIVADVLLPDGKNVNQSLVLNGWCWWAREYAPKDLALRQAEEVAKAMRKGIWEDPNPVPPWLYRRRLRSGAYP